MHPRANHMRIKDGVICKLEVFVLLFVPTISQVCIQGPIICVSKTGSSANSRFSSCFLFQQYPKYASKGQSYAYQRRGHLQTRGFRLAFCSNNIPSMHPRANHVCIKDGVICKLEVFVLLFVAFNTTPRTPFWLIIWLPAFTNYKRIFNSIKVIQWRIVFANKSRVHSMKAKIKRPPNSFCDICN